MKEIRDIRGKQNGSSKMLTTAFEGLVILNYASNKSTVSFSEKCKDLFTEASYIKGIVVRTKLKKGEYN